MNMPPPSSESKNKPCKKQACHLLSRFSFLGLFFDPEVRGHMFFLNVGSVPTDYAALYARR
jgi:hypothetical protein